MLGESVAVPLIVASPTISSFISAAILRDATKLPSRHLGPAPEPKPGDTTPSDPDHLILDGALPGYDQYLALAFYLVNPSVCSEQTQNINLYKT